MSGGKFASMTSALLVRKGDAAPSVIAPSATEIFARYSEQFDATRPLRTPRPSNAPPLLIVQDLKASERFLSRHEDPGYSDNAKKPRRRTVTLAPAGDETIALIAVKKGIARPDLLRLAREAGGNEIIVPVTVDRNADGSVLLTLLGSPEIFTYDMDTGRWIGSEGSAFIGRADALDDTNGWSVTITLNEMGLPSLEICHDGDCEELTLDHAIPQPA